MPHNVQVCSYVLSVLAADVLHKHAGHQDLHKWWINASPTDFPPVNPVSTVSTVRYCITGVCFTTGDFSASHVLHHKCVLDKCLQVLAFEAPTSRCWLQVSCRHATALVLKRTRFNGEQNLTPNKHAWDGFINGRWVTSAVAWCIWILYSGGSIPPAAD